jgi:glycine hydroxymethyltransferase
MTIVQLFERLGAHEAKFHSSFSFIPSENLLSPVARLAFLSDAYSRYYFGEKEVFGHWTFEGGSIAGEVQRDILQPALLRLGQAEFVDMRPVSGLTAMTVALAAFGDPGTRVLTMPLAYGGHPDTSYVAARLGYEVGEIPFSDWRTLDHEALGAAVSSGCVRLVYVDHATSLGPIDITALVHTVRAASPVPVHVHVDTSHVNGLVWGGQVPNPLACGADSYGGSTHKTFPGPHKAVLFTNSEEVAERLTMASVNIISHHHLGDVLALAISVLEFEQCGGVEYARMVVDTARAMAAALHARGLQVQGGHADGFTQNHQVWLDIGAERDVYDLGSQLFRAGLIVNPHTPIPSLGRTGLRLGLSEATRLGLAGEDIGPLADIFADVASGAVTPEDGAAQTKEIRGRCAPRYCFGPDVLEQGMAAMLVGAGDLSTDMDRSPLDRHLYS